MEQTVIELRGANIYQDNQNLVLSDVSIEMSKGEFVYLIGQTGSGKSSLMKTLYADLPLVSGSGMVAGFTLPIKASLIPKLRRRLGIVFQDFQLLPDRNVFENLNFVLKATGWTDKQKRRNRISEVLMQVGVEFTSAKYPHQISGGEQQRVAIARSLLNDPSLIIADEPTGNLDPETGLEILELFKKINKGGTAVLFATHNFPLLETFPSRTWACRKGQLVDLGVWNP